MKYACNYLTEVVDLLNKEKINLDYIKYPSVNNTNIEELKYVKEVTKKDIIFHGLITTTKEISSILSNDFIDTLDIQANKEAIKISNTPGLSLHLGNDKFGKKDDHTEKELLNILYKNIDYLKTNFTNDLDFLEIENRQQAYNLETLTPHFITEAINISECNFLIDISHAASAAKLLGMDYMDYIKKLPLDKVNETHLNGWKFSTEFISHIEMIEEGYKTLEYIVKNTPINIITLEYGINDHMLNFIKNKEENDYNGVPIIEIGKVNEEAEEQIIRQIDRIRNICETK